MATDYDGWAIPGFLACLCAASWATILTGLAFLAVCRGAAPDADARAARGFRERADVV